VGDIYLIKALVFPKLFGIAKFYVGEPLSEVVAECTFVNERVVSEIVGAGTITAMHVGHDDEFCSLAHQRRKGANGNRGVRDMGLIFVVVIWVVFVLFFKSV
jgi:hypothetical protein